MNPILKKTFKNILFIVFLPFLFNPVLSSQSIEQEIIGNLINELTPARILKKSYKNLDILGFDVLDKNENRLTSSRFIFHSSDQFYVVLYGKRKIIPEKNPLENNFDRCRAAFKHQNGGYFWSTKTTYLFGKQESKGQSEEWQIGGVYKIRLAFEVPEFALPGKYTLIINKETSNLPYQDKMIEFDEINIIIKISDVPKDIKIADPDLSLGGCLLNPALQLKEHIALPWTGNIEFYIDRNISEFNKIIITARGTPAFGIYPLLKVYADNAEIGSVYVRSEWIKYAFDIKPSKEALILKIRFDNDATGNGEDRNLYVNRIELER